MRFAVLAVLLVTLSACSHTKLTDWSKPGVSVADFNADSKDCQREVNNGGANVLGFAAYNNCMEARGYTRLF
jgi:hypothetical protein